MAYVSPGAWQVFGPPVPIIRAWPSVYPTFTILVFFSCSIMSLVRQEAGGSRGTSLEIFQLNWA